MDDIFERAKSIAQRVPFPFSEVKKMVLAGLTDEEIEQAARLGLSHKEHSIYGRWNQLEKYSFSVMDLKTEKLFEVMEVMNEIADSWARKRGWLYYWFYYRSILCPGIRLRNYIRKMGKKKAGCGGERDDGFRKSRASEDY